MFENPLTFVAGVGAGIVTAIGGKYAYDAIFGKDNSPKSSSRKRKRSSKKVSAQRPSKKATVQTE